MVQNKGTNMRKIVSLMMFAIFCQIEGAKKLFKIPYFCARFPSIVENCLTFLLSRFVVGSSSAKIPQSQKHSAKASRIMSDAKTLCPALARPLMVKVAPSFRFITTEYS
jgi:hypothetical protein